MAGTVHIEKTIKAPVARVYRAFQQTRALKVSPSAEIVALVRNHTIVHRYSDIVPGFGIWSFVEKAGGKATLLVLDHVDAHESAEERDSVTFYWKGLIENLAAFCEGRKIPFDHDAGDYRQGMKP